MLLPNGMDGVGGLTQPHIPPGKTFVYEFVAAEVRHLHVPPARRRDGADGDGHDGLLRRPSEGPGRAAGSTATSCSCSTPTTSSPAATRRRSTRCSTSTSGPGTAASSRASIRSWCARATGCASAFGNLTMTNHPIHMHGHDFEVTGTDGGWVPESGALAGGHDRRRGRPDARLRVRRRRAGRLGVPLPQVASHDERDGPRRADHDRRRPCSGRRRADHASSCPTTW